MNCPQERACFPIGFGLGALVGMLMPLLGHGGESAELDMMLDGEERGELDWARDFAPPARAVRWRC